MAMLVSGRVTVWPFHYYVCFLPSTRCAEKGGSLLFSACKVKGRRLVGELVGFLDGRSNFNKSARKTMMDFFPGSLL